jgi:DNA-binding NarL/FixJ family response regulator
MTRISVAVIDGQRAFADALASRLAAEPDLQVVAVSASAAAARRLLDDHYLDVVLLDSELAQDLRPPADMSPPPRVILLGPVPDATRTVEALHVGITGWVPKEESIKHLLDVVRGVMRGEIWLPDKAVGPVLRFLLQQPRERDTSSTDPLTRLTPREREVLAYLTLGISRREAAERMHLSAGTVRTHVQHLMGKLGVHSALEAVAVARQARLRIERPGKPDEPDE